MKKYILVLLSVVLGSFAVNAQNLALTATAAHSGGGATIYGAQNYNDQVIQTGTFGWVSTSGNPSTTSWIEYTWPSNMSFSKIKIFNDNASTRTLTGATIQYWNGSSYVNITTYSVSPQLVYEVTFPTATSTKLRLTNLVTTGSQASNPALNEIEVRLGSAYDLSPSAIVSPTNVCGDPSVPFTVRVTNNGSAAMTGFNITAVLNGAMNATYTRTNFTRTIASGGSDTIIFDPAINTSVFTSNLNLKVYTSHALDTLRANDTLNSTIGFLGSPPNPVFTANPINTCGTTPVTISTQAMANTKTLWYPTAASNTLLSQSDTLTTSPLLNPVTTYYAARARFGASTLNVGNIVQWSYYSTGYGYMIDITANASSSVIVDSVSFLCISGLNAAGDISVYYKPGTHVGFQTNSSAWTLGVKLSNYQPAAYPNNTTIPTGGIIIPAGATYGFYVTTSACALYINNPVTVYNSAEISMPAVNTVMNPGAFSGITITNTYQPGFILKYRKICSSNRLPITINMSPAPTGASVDATNPFKGTDNGGQTANTKDIVGEGDTAIYNITPPTGFTNSGYGTTWQISQMSFVTGTGKAPNAADTLTTFPSSSVNGSFRFIPNTNYVDSTMKLTLKIQNVATGCDSTIVRYMYVAPKPVANFNFSSACFGSPVQFTTASTIKVGQISYSWDFGDAGTDDVSITENPSWTYSAPGTYTVTLTVTSNYGYSKTITKQVAVSYTPVTDFAFTNVCFGQPTTFTNKSTLAGPPLTLTYKWDFDNTTTGTQTNPSLTYTTVGMYNVTLTTTSSAGCKSTKTKQIYVFPNPVPNFNNGNSCSGLNTQFNNTSTILYGAVGYKWYFGDGTFATIAAPEHSYSSLGSYTVRLVATSQFGCTDSLVKTISVKSKPVADFTAPTACDGEFMNFTNTSTLSGTGTLSSAWVFGDGNSQNNNNSSFGYKYPAPGTYNVKLTVTSSDNCVDTKQTTVVVGDMPKAGFSVTSAVCAGSPTSFANASSVANGTLNYDWNFGAATSTQKDPQFTFTTAGSYDVWLKASTALGCTDSVKNTVTVNNNPTISFTVTHTNPAQHQVTCTPSSTSMNSYHWDMGDGTTFNQVAPVYSYQGVGPYNIKLTVTDNNGCSNNNNKNTDFIYLSSQNVFTATGVEVYPNPFTSSAAVKVSLSTSQKVEVMLVDQTGRTLATVANGNYNKGTHTFDIVADQYNLSKGSYFVMVTIDGQKFVKPLVKM